MKKFLMSSSVSVFISALFWMQLAQAGHKAPKTDSGFTLIDESAIDHSINPCDDFYQFACGAWIAKTEIPADQSRWYRSFSVLFSESEKRLQALLETSATGKLKDFYQSCMDTSAVEVQSDAVLKSEFSGIDGFQSVTTLPSVLAQFHLKGVNAFFNLYSEQDSKDATLMIAAVDQGGLGLPGREYYLENDEKSKAIRENYLQFIGNMLTLTGESSENATAQSEIIFDIETALARVSMTKEDQRDPLKTYNRIERDGLNKLAADFNWNAYFTALGYPGVTQIDVKSLDFFKGLNALLLTTSVQDLRTYLKWKVLTATTPSLGKKFVDEAFRFSSKNFTGQPEQEARWKTCVGASDSSLGDALGKLYADKYFQGKSKDKAISMIVQVEKAFEENVGTLSWMDDATKKAAIVKLHLFTNKIGFPDKWETYNDVTISGSSYAKNRIALNIFSSKFSLNQIGKPVDRKTWGMTPPTINAYYNPSMNEIVFPAGILQAPFFNVGANEASNYGAIGMVMGHELTHGFDDQGSQYDGNGNLTNWWSETSSKNFQERTACVVNQYNDYTVLDGLHVNGAFTLGENLADLGGIKLAYKAFKTARKGKSSLPAVAGFNQEQQFFLAFAQGWCGKMRPEKLRQQIKGDPHSPSQFRVNGPLADLPEFAKVFSCKAGSEMAPANRCTVW